MHPHICRVPDCKYIFCCMYIFFVQKKLDEYKEREKARGPAARSKMADLDRRQIIILELKIEELQKEIASKMAGNH